MRHTEKFYQAHNWNPERRIEERENRTLKKVQAGEGDGR